MGRILLAEEQPRCSERSGQAIQVVSVEGNSRCHAENYEKVFKNVIKKNSLYMSVATISSQQNALCYVTGYVCHNKINKPKVLNV